MEPCIVYMTANDQPEAVRIGRALVAERLVACINILGPTMSIYRWQGAVEEAGEVAFIAKTTMDRVPAVQARVIELHSYDVPCVVAVPISGGSPAFLDWIASESMA